MTDNTNKDEIAALKAEVDKLKAALAPTPDDRAAIGAWKDQMRELAERRMSLASPFSRADLAAFEAAAPTSVVKDIALRDARAPTGRPGMIPSTQQQPTNVRPAGNRSGWVEPAPLSNPPGVNWADRLMDHQDAKDRLELIEQKAKEQALLKAAEKPSE